MWTPQDLTNDKSNLVQVMAWCRQATSHYLSQCWPRSLSPHGITKPQWVKIYGPKNGAYCHFFFQIHTYISVNLRLSLSLGMAPTQICTFCTWNLNTPRGLVFVIHHCLTKIVVVICLRFNQYLDHKYWLKHWFASVFILWHLYSYIPMHIFRLLFYTSVYILMYACVYINLHFRD